MNTFDNDHNPHAVSANADRWTPILNGEVFCSPACGSGCKREDYDRAVLGANTLAAIMGYGWETRIWENLGWHYVVRKGCGEIRYDGKQFIATIRLEANVLITRSAATPQQALAIAGGVLDEKIARLSRLRSALSLEPFEIEDCTVIR